MSTIIRMPYRTILLPETPLRFASVKDFLKSAPSSLPSGYIEIANGLPLHLRWRNTGSNVTVVFFTAAVGRGVKSVPVFSGERVSSGLDVNVLMISDPTLILSEKLMVAWYIGNRHQPILQRQLSSVISAFQGTGRVILYGASGGGFPVLFQNKRLRNATSFVANPTVNATNRALFSQYLFLAWGVSEVKDLPSHITTDLREVYSEKVGNQVIYLQNSFDQTFVSNQLWPFQTISDQRSKIFYLTPPLGQGHVSLDWGSSRRIISELIATPDWDTLKVNLSATRLTSAKTPQMQRLNS